MIYILNFLFFGFWFLVTLRVMRAAWLSALQILTDRLPDTTVVDDKGQRLTKTDAAEALAAETEYNDIHLAIALLLAIFVTIIRG